MPDTPAPLNLAVVGHTNTGKTSLLRTLLRDEQFGHVADQPGTTRQVERARLMEESGNTRLILHDTPGLEDAMGTLDALDEQAPTSQRLDGPDRLRILLNSPLAQDRFEQECRVLDTVLRADAALVVIDARDPVLPKHRDELSLLAQCGRPLLPVLNFTEDPQANPHAWRTALARQGLHASVDFDTVVPPLDGEMRLMERLAILLDTHATQFQALQHAWQLQRAQRRHDALHLIAELLIDAAAYRLTCSDEPDAIRRTTHTLRDQLRHREQRCVQALLQRYQFSTAVFPRHELPLEGERWGMDLFHPQALRQFGIQVGKGLATGAMAGATVDVLTGGLSLGAATLLGAALGGTWQGAEQWGQRLLARMRGRREMTVDDAVLQLLGVRQLALLHALEARGHAATQAIHPKPSECGNTLPSNATALLAEARSQPAWSGIPGVPAADERRAAVIETLAQALSKQPDTQR